MAQIDMDKFRPLPFYFINSPSKEELTAEDIDCKVGQLKEDGFGGLVLFNLGAYGFSEDDYLEADWFEVTERYILAARKHGLELWITDHWRCPPGDVAGKIAKINPTLKQKRLALGKDGKVEVVEVSCGFPAFELPESSKLFIELVYERYEKFLGKYFGNGLTGIFTDADNRRIDNFILNQFEGDYYPWSDNFAETFQAAYGYDIVPFLESIVKGENTKESYDYYCHCETLYIQWLVNNYNWCREHNLKYTFHTSDTGPFPRSRCRRSSVFSEGQPFNIFKYSDFPGTDHEACALDGGTHFDSRIQPLKISLGELPAGPVRTDSFADTKYDLRAKYASSAAEYYKKPGAMCELFAATNHAVSPGELRRIAAWQLFQGITFFVPHAICHFFRGASKYAAPPEQHLATGGSCREINDFIAKYTYIATQGELAPEVLVADVTEKVRRGAEDTEQFFEYTDRLNHAGITYLIVPEETPGAVDVMAGAPELPVPSFTFTGGELIAMRRKLADGTMFLMVCNLYSEDELSGTLSFEGRSVELALASGEVAVIGGPFEEFRAPVRAVRTEPLTFPAPALFHSENILPLHYNFKWRNEPGIDGKLRLRIPEEYAAAGVKIDGAAVEGRAVKVFDDKYVEYPLPTAAGEHCYEVASWVGRPLELGRPAGQCGNGFGQKVIDYKFYLPAFIAGDFDVDLQTAGDYHHKMFDYYNLSIWGPERFEFTLKPRRTQLDGISWALQGQPFYSGSATYKFDISGFAGKAILEIPDAAVRIKAVVDGKTVGETGMPPFRIALGDISDSTLLEVVMTNTIGNRLEEYRVPSGIVNGAKLLFEAK